MNSDLMKPTVNNSPNCRLFVYLDESGVAATSNSPVYVQGGVAIRGERSVNDVRTKWREFLKQHKCSISAQNWHDSVFDGFATFLVNNSIRPVAHFIYQNSATEASAHEMEQALINARISRGIAAQPDKTFTSREYVHTLVLLHLLSSVFTTLPLVDSPIGSVIIRYERLRLSPFAIGVQQKLIAKYDSACLKSILDELPTGSFPPESEWYKSGCRWETPPEFSYLDNSGNTDELFQIANAYCTLISQSTAGQHPHAISDLERNFRDSMGQKPGAYLRRDSNAFVNERICNKWGLNAAQSKIVTPD